MPRSSRTTAVRRSILIRGKPAEVFSAFREEQRLREWYFDDAEIDFRVGGTLTFYGPEGAVRANILEIVEPEKFVIAYEPPWWGTVTWELAPSGASTRLSLVHEGFEGREEWLERFAWGWEAFLKALKAQVEGRPVR
jgi:uncharacterized protein YndB with AHSA1/START domain